MAVLIAFVAGGCADDLQEPAGSGSGTADGTTGSTTQMATTSGTSTTAGDDGTGSATNGSTDSSADGSSMSTDSSSGDPSGDTIAGSSDSTGSGSTATGSTSVTGGSSGGDTVDTSSGSSASTGGTTGESDGSSSTTESSTCGDSVVDPAELCFVGPDVYPVGDAPSDVAVGDFDGDAALDLAIANAVDDTVTIWFGDGAGSFTDDLTVDVGDNPVRLGAAELNGDLVDDLLVISAADGISNGTITILLADGGGDFEPGVDHVVGVAPSDFGFGDLGDISGGAPNGDGAMDFAIASPGSGEYHSFTNDGSGSFTVNGPYQSGTVPVVPFGIALGSINNFPLDVFVCGGDRYAASPGNGNGTIDNGTAPTGTAGVDLRRAAGGLFDDDDDMDAVVVDPGADQVVFFHGAAGGSFSRLFYPVGDDPSGVAVADVSGENYDLVVTNRGDDTITILLGGGTTSFVEAEVLGVGGGPSGVDVGDLNGDGIGDIAVSNESDGTVSVLLSDP